MTLLALGCAGALFCGCSKQAEPTTPGGMVTQGEAPKLNEAEAAMGEELAELTRELKKYVISTKERPASFEDFAAKTKVTVPPAPAGKKFAISKEMRVVLVDQ